MRLHDGSMSRQQSSAQSVKKPDTSLQPTGEDHHCVGAAHVQDQSDLSVADRDAQTFAEALGYRRSIAARPQPTCRVDVVAAVSGQSGGDGGGYLAACIAMETKVLYYFHSSTGYIRSSCSNLNALLPRLREKR